MAFCALMLPSAMSSGESHFGSLSSLHGVCRALLWARQQKALLSAVESCRGHLYALVRFYSVELLFVAGSVVYQGLVEPSAPLDG